MIYNNHLIFLLNTAVDGNSVTVNITKTKVLIFSKGPMTKRNFFCVMVFTMGTIMSRNGKFNNAKKHLTEQAAKALYGVLCKIR
jgi:hypothetical protein